MKKIPKVLQVIFVMLFLFSCDEPETVVTNFVHPDGSVTRRVVMKSSKKLTDPSKNQVPVDSTWKLTNSFEVKDKDTSWILTAEKDFKSAQEINLSYQADSGSNQKLSRSAEFQKSFRWFNTFYRFSETVSHVLNTNLKAEDVLTEEQLRYFYMPSTMMDSLINSSDSLMYKEKKAINDSVENRYIFTALVEEWCTQYLKLSADSSLIMSGKEKLIELSENGDFSGDTVFRITFGEEYFEKNKDIIDKSLNKVDTLFDKALSSVFYTCETVMPYNLVATNGFVDKTGKISWPVDSKYFVSQDYIMWAESKKTNTWAWVVSGAFVAFVMIGLIASLIRKKK